MRGNFGLMLLLFGFGNAGLQAQTGGVLQLESPEAHLQRVSLAEYRAGVERLQALVARCKAKADACDASSVDQDLAVEAGEGREFTERRQWLRSALDDAKKEKDEGRAELMTKASARLASDMDEALAVPAASSLARTSARGKADAILGRTEFRAVEEQGWLSRQWGRLRLWLGTLIYGAFSKMPRSPWVVPAIEGALLIGAAVALILWAWRVTQQQRVELAVPANERQVLWQKESDDWARRAEVQAAAGDWREAVHCLYWAAIVMLEGKRLWRPNRARTPREYLPLLEAGSARQRALGGLTRLFERIWYGLRPAGQQEFEQAQALLEELKAA